MPISWNSERKTSEVSEQERKDPRMLHAGGHPKFAWGKWNSVWKDDEHAQHALYPRRRARACTPGHLQLYSLDSVVGPLLVRDTVDWIHIIFRSNSYHDVIWSSKLLDAGRWSWGIIQGIQSFNIARTQLEGAPAQLCQHQLGSLGTHLTTLGSMSDIRRACMIQTRGVSINVYIISTSINIVSTLQLSIFWQFSPVLVILTLWSFLPCPWNS